MSNNEKYHEARREHFYLRCRERGITTTDPKEVLYNVEMSVATGDEGYAKFVFRMNAGYRLYRFMVPEGVFYAVVKPDKPYVMTCLTQEMLRNLRNRRRKRLVKAGARYTMKRKGQIRNGQT